MPGWHDATKQLQADGDVQMVGIIQEQHPDRCALFMQWKDMGWPILVDSLNLLDFDKVPFTFAIDEHGVIRHTRIRPQQLQARFLSRTWDAPDDLPPHELVLPDLPAMEARVADADANDPAAARLARDLGDALFLHGGPDRLGDAINAYTTAIQRGVDDDGRSYFRRGVARRARHDSPHRQHGDFRQAVADWTRALEINPNNYIWRRRIQQYGPRLDKPYPFYDWVHTARRELAARGETPHPLVVEPSGAEFAHPQRGFEDAGADATNPDPDGRINRDDGGLIRIDSAIAPARVTPGQAVRVHITLSCNTAARGHWNNESEPVRVWITPPDGWGASARLLTAPSSEESAVSDEQRRVEFELQVPADTASGAHTVSGYALYYVCEDADGVCHFLRQDFEVTVEVR